MKVAILMAVYNNEEFIEDALASLLRQRNDAELDIVVVNDGSTDGTTDILRKAASGHPEIRLVETENRGVTRARNASLDALAPNTDFVTFLDGDDLMAADRIKRDLSLVGENESISLVYSSMCYFQRAEANTLQPSADSRTLVGRNIHLSSTFSRLSLIETIGRFDEDFVQAEDTDYIFRIFESGVQYLVSDEIGHYYRRHPGGMTQDKKLSAREFARAMLKSAKRRKTLKNYRLPADVFNVDHMGELARWD